MCSGLILGEKIDILIKEIGLTQTDLAKQINISQSTIASWKTRNSLPPIETISRIADFFQVSLEWLVTEDPVSGISDHQMVLLSRKVIRNRIYETIGKKTNNPDADNEVSHKCFFTNMPYLSYRVVYNWAMGRININEYILQNIAFTLGVTTDYLFGGPTEDTKNKNDDDILKTAHRNLNDLFCLDNLTGERKSAAHSMLNQLNELEHLKSIEKQNSEKTDLK